jgi:hypothetical protein
MASLGNGANRGGPPIAGTYTRGSDLERVESSLMLLALSGGSTATLLDTAGLNGPSLAPFADGSGSGAASVNGGDSGATGARSADFAGGIGAPFGGGTTSPTPRADALAIAPHAGAFESPAGPTGPGPSPFLASDPIPLASPPTIAMGSVATVAPAAQSVVAPTEKFIPRPTPDSRVPDAGTPSRSDAATGPLDANADVTSPVGRAFPGLLAGPDPSRGLDAARAFVGSGASGAPTLPMGDAGRAAFAHDGSVGSPAALRTLGGDKFVPGGHDADALPGVVLVAAGTGIDLPADSGDGSTVDVIALLASPAPVPGTGTVKLAAVGNPIASGACVGIDCPVARLDAAAVQVPAPGTMALLIAGALVMRLRSNRPAPMLRR